jgi:hypothetical protein
MNNPSGKNILVVMITVALLSIWIAAISFAQTPWQSAKVYYNEVGKLVYARDAAGNQIPDFSYAGYKNSVVPIPTNAVVDSVSPVPGDNTTNIQNAINRVAARSLDGNGFRGTLLMKAGRYRVSGILNLNASGVVLRGVGEGSDSLTNTIILATGDSLAQPQVLIAGGGTGGSNSSAWSGSLTSNVNIVTDSVHVGDKTFQVANASLFSFGDNIVIYHPDTTPWKRAVDWGGVPNDTGITSYWAGVTIPIKYNRYITAIDGNNVTIDAPVFNTLVRSLSQSYIYKTDRNNIKTNIGIENLRVDIINPYNQLPTNSNGDERHHAQDAIWLGKIEDSWVRNCTVLHFVHSGFETSIATRVTIDSCTAIDPISIITGSRRYNFNTYIASQLILFSNCYASYGRHSYVSNGTSTVSGVVFYNCTAEETYAPSEGHRLWSQGLLYDNVKDINTNVATSDHVLGLYNRGNFGSGHGWASVHSVAWNCSTGTRAIIIQKPPTAQNYAIGCFGNVTGVTPPAPFSNPQGYIEGINVSALNPQSLYKAQFDDRLSGDLPVTISSFVGNFISEDHVKLEWTTITEKNNYGFYMQKFNADSNSFVTTITSFQQGETNSVAPKNYSWIDESVSDSVVKYRLLQIDNDGLQQYFGPITINKNATGVNSNPGKPNEFKLSQNFPNPFNPTTIIKYELPTTYHTILKIYNIIGSEVATLVDEIQGPGYKSVAWNAKSMPSGLYLVKLCVGNYIKTIKVLLLK